MRRTDTLLLVVLAVVAAGCRNADVSREQLTEVGRARAGSLDVVLLSAEGALKQDDRLTIEFRDSNGSLVDVGTVKGSATMPMAGMAPMFGSVTIQPTGAPGRYMAAVDLGMAGEWRMTVEWSGPAGQGSVNILAMVE